MKNSFKVILLSILLSTFLNCKDKDSSNNGTNMETAKPKPKEQVNNDQDEEYDTVYISGDSVRNIQETLRGIQSMKDAYQKFLDDSNDDHDGELIASEPDMKVAGELIALGMRQLGLKRLNSNEMQVRIKNIFKIDLNKHDKCKVWQKQDNILFFSDNPTHTLDIFVPSIWNKNFNSIDISNNIVVFDSFFYFFNGSGDLDGMYDKENNMFKIEIRKEDLHRNLLLFNDNKHSMSWLMRNDPYFLDYIVKIYGYTREKLVNGFVLNEVYKKTQNRESFDKSETADYFAIKFCDNNMEIREELMQYIDNVTTLEDNDLLLMLDNYAAEIVNFDNGYSNALREGYTKEELYRIFAYSAYYSYKGFAKFDKGLGKYSSTRENWPNFCALTSIGQNEDVQEALKENNYYNIPGLREAVDRINTLE